MNKSRKEQRVLRHKRITKRIKAINNNKPRLVITKTNAHISAQLISSETLNTIASSGTVQLKLANGNKENAAKVGSDIAKKAIKLGINEICFDTGGSKYHGRVAALANAAREAGLKF